MTQTLLISPDGMLGRAFLQLLANEPLTPVRYPDIDLTKRETLRAHVSPSITRVINCAAYTDVDGAESNEELATAINGHGVRALAERCREVGAKLIHFGTDYVFDGHASSPYPVDAKLEPEGAYGRSKAVGEQALREVGAPYLHIRTSWLYAPWAKNFVRTIATLARTKDKLRVVNDQRGRPTSAEHLAKSALALDAKDCVGDWHVTDGGECTWFEFASEIVRLSGAACVVEPCTSEEFARPAKRPPYSVLDIGRTEAVIGPMPAWQRALADVFQRLE